MLPCNLAAIFGITDDGHLLDGNIHVAPPALVDTSKGAPAQACCVLQLLANLAGGGIKARGGIKGPGRSGSNVFDFMAEGRISGLEAEVTQLRIKSNLALQLLCQLPDLLPG